MLQVSPVVETPAFSEVTEEDCKCDFDDFVIVGEIWKLMGRDGGTLHHSPDDTHHTQYVTVSFRETPPQIRLCP